MPAGRWVRSDGLLRLRVASAFAHGDTSLPMNLPANRSHPERSAGSVATGTQSKDPVSFTMDVPVQFHGILRLRAAPPSPARRSAQDDSRFCWFIPHQKTPRRTTPLRMTREGGLQTRPESVHTV